MLPYTIELAEHCNKMDTDKAKPFKIFVRIAAEEDQPPNQVSLRCTDNKVSLLNFSELPPVCICSRSSETLLSISWKLGFLVQDHLGVFQKTL